MADVVPSGQQSAADAQLAAEKAKSDALKKKITEASGTNANGANTNQKSQTQTGTAQPPGKLWWTTESAMTMSSVILIFGAIVVALAAWLIRRERDGQVILKVLATIMIITFSVFLIVAGWSDTQIGPAMGLLGTIAGYLLGKDAKSSTGNDVAPPHKDAPPQQGGPPRQNPGNGN